MHLDLVTYLVKDSKLDSISVSVYFCAASVFTFKPKTPLSFSISRTPYKVIEFARIILWVLVGSLDIYYSLFSSLNVI